MTKILAVLAALLLAATSAAVAHEEDDEDTYAIGLRTRTAWRTGFNVQGSCNNLCDTAPDPVEFAARNAANIRWLHDTFTAAKAAAPSP